MNPAATCKQAHYASIVDAQKDVEIYQVGDIDCADCLRRMVEKHESVAEIFRSRLTTLSAAPRHAPRCQMFDACCINPIYCAEREACCAGDPNCAYVDRGENLP